LREQFGVWYPLSTEDRERFIMEGLVVLDTNVLLNLYRMTAEAREDVLALLRRFGDRLWIPHQVGLEFHRNRLTVIHDQEQTGQKLRAAIIEAGEKIQDAVKSVRDHPVIDRTALAATVNESLARITNYLEQASKEPSLSMKAAMHSDPVLDALTHLFRGKVGMPYSADQTTRVMADAKRRIDERRPPGYADAKKDGDRATGDYVLWRQMLDEAVKRRLPVLFVTNDQKEDWYRRLHGLTIGPRVELVNEMVEEAGVSFHAQTLALFVDTAPSWLSSTIKDITVSEVNRLDEVDRASLRADLASQLAENELERHAFQQVLEREVNRQDFGEEIFSRLARKIVRLEARRYDLNLRVAELQAELQAAQKFDDEGTSGDPRSYARAIEARLHASSEMLKEVTGNLSMLREEQRRLTK